MMMSKDEKVQVFLSQLSLAFPDLFNILNKVRLIIFQECRDVQEKMMYGGIIFSKDKKMFAGLFSYKNH